MDFKNMPNSPSRRYVVIVTVWNGEILVKRFTLPEGEENTCDHATWYFYNRLDGISAGGSAMPAELFENIKDVK